MTPKGKIIWKGKLKSLIYLMFNGLIVGLEGMKATLGQIESIQDITKQKIIIKPNHSIIRPIFSNKTSYSWSESEVCRYT